MSRPVALVTGASSGIGEQIARLLAEQGEDLVLVARSQPELARVQGDIAAATGRFVAVLPLDLERPDAADAIAAALRSQALKVRHLVNNAGFGLAGDMGDLPAGRQLGMVDLNCRALLALTLAFLPEIRANRGGILNVASVAGFTPGPGLAVYYATKAFVVSLTRALGYEERGNDIRVCALCPGPVATNFGARAGFGGSRAMALAGQLSARDVAHLGLAGYYAGRRVVVPGLVTRLMIAVLAVVPTRFVLPVLAAAQRQRRN
ncbi:SDR family NAD(P)-dependent oxidoreductase [Labrys monachus]|uniref:Short-subunit dehydrogenase n=1 Tax=Labrys monachus TaxID=217067 RepID=A0ABU0FQF6_9HYPH|nr:SDR family NAD(P)-dependent oxidoreductase [Labrys monachus]MDQ0396288.1 short-subunit dehydrogenase [Labrys monachus]